MRCPFLVLVLLAITPVSRANQTSTAHWRFEEASGATVVDFGPNGIDGTLNGLPLRAATVPLSPVPQSQLANSQSLDLNWMGRTNGGFVTIDDGGLMSPGASSFTLEAWVQLDHLSDTSSPNERQWLVTKKQANTSDSELDLGFLVQAGPLGTTGRELCFAYGDGPSTFQIVSSLEVTTTGWHFVSVAYDADAFQLRFGINGVFETVALVKPSRATADPLLLGAHSNAAGATNQYLRGSIDEVRYTGIFLAPDQLLDATFLDCNTNLTPDFIEILSGSATDCNRNCIPDSCDITGGASGDCQMDGIPDECQIADFRYFHPESDADGQVVSDGEYTGWLNHHVVEQGMGTITHMDIWFGDLAVGSTVGLYVWSDPNGDGDPTDATVLSSLTMSVTAANDSQLLRIDIPDVNVGPDGTSFFVGALNMTPGGHGAGFDLTPPHVAGVSWVIGKDSGPIDPNDLSNDAVEFALIEASFDGNFNVGAVIPGLADCNQNVVPDACDITLGTSADTNTNGVPDECEFVTTAFVPDQFVTIQAALDVLPSGSQVIVRPGTYAESFSYNGKDMLVRSESGPGVTTIDGTGLSNVVRFVSGEGPGAVLQGFTVTGADKAVRIDNASPTIVGNVITGNVSSDAGGGILVVGVAAPRIVNNEITFNSAGDGGGIWLELSNTAPLVQGNRIANNTATASFGAGVGAFNGSPQILDNVICDNTNTDNSGGGIFLLSTGNGVPLVQRNLVCGNSSAQDGGGLWVSGTDPLITDNVFAGNDAPDGGGMYVRGQTRDVKRNTIVHNSATRGGGIMFDGATSTAAFASNIIRGNTASIEPQVFLNGMPVVFQYCNVAGGIAGTGNFDAPPLYVDVDGPDDILTTYGDNDYRLSSSSPCIDTGDPADLPGLDLDLDGRSRPCDGDGDNVPIVDVGAFEFGGCYVNLRPFSTK